MCIYRNRSPSAPNLNGKVSFDLNLNLGTIKCVAHHEHIVFIMGSAFSCSETSTLLTAIEAGFGAQATCVRVPEPFTSQVYTRPDGGVFISNRCTSQCTRAPWGRTRQLRLSRLYLESFGRGVSYAAKEGTTRRERWRRLSTTADSLCSSRHTLRHSGMRMTRSLRPLATNANRNAKANANANE